MKIKDYLIDEKVKSLRLMTIDDLANNTPLMKLKVVKKGTKEDLERFAKKKHLVWKDSKTFMFGGYWYDKKNGEAYLPT